MTPGAQRIRAMPRKDVAQWRIRCGFVFRQLRNLWRRRRDHLAEEAAHDPEPAFHWTGSQAGRTLGEEDGHRQQAATFIPSRIIDANPVVVRTGNARNAVVPGQHRIHKRVVPIEQVEHGAVVSNHVLD